MTHKDLIKKFTEKITLWGKASQMVKIAGWWKKGPNAVRIRFNDGAEIVFTYISEKDWKVETLSMWEQSKDGI